MSFLSQKRRKILFVICILVLTTLIIIPPPITRYRDRAVHLSIDDVKDCLVELTVNEDKYESIFDHYFFRRLKILHDLFGARFTLYLFPLDVKLEGAMSKFHHDFHDSKDWLKLGFHGVSQNFSRENTGDSALFVQRYKETNQLIDYLGGARTDILRLHYWYATDVEKIFLKNAGVKTLLTSEVDSPSYSLSEVFMKRLQNGSITDSALHYLKTDIRVEDITLTPYFTLLDHHDNDTLVIYSHEWFLGRKNYLRFARLIEILALSKCRFIN